MEELDRGECSGPPPASQVPGASTHVLDEILPPASRSAGRRRRDRLFRLAYRLAYLGLRAWWWVLRPHTTSAMLAVWRDERLLLVRTSYRAGWALPGGRVRPGETPGRAVRREIREELGLDLEQAALTELPYFEHEFENRRDEMHVFELRRWTVELRIDGRELVAARFFGVPECRDSAVQPHVLEYLQRRGIVPNLAPGERVSP